MNGAYLKCVSCGSLPSGDLLARNLIHMCYLANTQRYLPIVSIRRMWCSGNARPLPSSLFDAYDYQLICGVHRCARDLSDDDRRHMIVQRLSAMCDGDAQNSMYVCRHAPLSVVQTDALIHHPCCMIVRPSIWPVSYSHPVT